MIRSTTPVWVASSASSSRPPPAISEIACVGQARLGRRPRGDARQHRVGVRRRARAAQDDRVAGLQAQRRGVDRHVRPGLVDDRDDAERHPHAPQLQAVGERLAVDHLADRIGQRGDLPHAGRRSARSARSSSVSRSISASASPLDSPGFEVARVGRQDLVGRLDQGVGDRLQRRVLDGGAERLQLAGGALGGPAGLGDRYGGGGHRPYRLRSRRRPLRRARSSHGGSPPRWPAATARGRPRTAARGPGAARRPSSCRSPCRRRRHRAGSRPRRRRRSCR